MDMENEEPFNALILGVDERSNDRGRSDTMIVLSVNPAKQSVLMFNIPGIPELVSLGMVRRIRSTMPMPLGALTCLCKRWNKCLTFPYITT